MRLGRFLVEFLVNQVSALNMSDAQISQVKLNKIILISSSVTLDNDDDDHLYVYL